MKTIKQLLTTVAVLLCSTTLQAHDFEVDGIYYNILSTDSLTVEVTYRGESCNEYSHEYSGDVIIPSDVTYSENVYSVTTIGGGSFYNCDSLTSIVIPCSVTSIESIGDGTPFGIGAFEGCSNLKTVTFGENSQLTSIGNEVFYNCSSLTSIEIPNSVKTIGVISAISNGAFEGCSNLKTVTFGENSQLTSIGNNVFYNCSSLTNIEIPNSVTSIGSGAFNGCSSLTSIEIPNSVTWLYFNNYHHRGAFENCSSLTNVTFEENSQLTFIVEYTFSGCSSLTNVTFGKDSQLTSIGDEVFYNCSSLTNIEIPNSVTSIGSGAFYNCSSLTSIEIPSGITNIEDDVFNGCTSLKHLSIEDGETILKLESNTFSDCSLETIYMGRTISFSSPSPFYNIRTLKTLTIGSDVTEIYGKTFYNCSGIESIYMTSVPPSAGDDTFSNTNYYLTTLYVPNGTLGFYQTADVWKEFWNIQEYEPTSSKDGEAEIPNFSITSNNISFSNANNSTIAIYSINGVLVKKIDKYTGEEITLENGVYIVCVGNKAMKIIL